MTSSLVERQSMLAVATLKTAPAKVPMQREDLNADVLARARRMLQTEVSFIHSSDFEQDDAENEIMDPAGPEHSPRSGGTSAPSGVPHYLTHLWDVALLTPEQELRLFRRMNFLRFRANAQRSRLVPENPKVELLDQVEKYIADADAARNHIVRANLRLVVSIARSFVTESTTLDELISDGNVILMKSVDRFDYGRGFRFSTYVTHAVQREFYRRYKNGQRRRVMEVLNDPEILFNSVESPEGLQERVLQHRQVAHLRQVMSTCLEPREFEIVDLRFGLNSDDGGQTLREVGAKLNISKERVRQLQTRAIEKIRGLARYNVETAE